MHERVDRSYIIGMGAWPQVGVDGSQLAFTGRQTVGFLQTFALGGHGFEASDDGSGLLAITRHRLKPDARGQPPIFRQCRAFLRVQVALPQFDLEIAAEQLLSASLDLVLDRGGQRG